MPSSPIRVGLIGLSASGSWASTAHLPYLQKSTRYRIAALCNSSVDAARAAIEAYGLPPSTKAYGSYQDLADDPDVDLVVCSVRVDRHHDAVVPAVKAGKHCYCEWPLGKDAAEAEELAGLAGGTGVRTMVGLQAHHSPVVRRVKELVEGGGIGEVLSVDFVGAAYNFGQQELAKYKYLSQREVGGNMVTIHFSHSMYAMLRALGELNSFSAILEVKRPKVELLDKPNGTVIETMQRTSHDQILIQGHLDSGALLSHHLRGGKAFPGSPGLMWRIYGETGEIQVTASGPNLQLGYEDARIQLHHHATGEVETVELAKDEWSELPLVAQNVARMYEAFADEGAADYPDWREAVVRHRLVEELYGMERASQDRPAGYRKVRSDH